MGLPSGRPSGISLQLVDRMESLRTGLWWSGRGLGVGGTGGGVACLLGTVVSKACGAPHLIPRVPGIRGGELPEVLILTGGLSCGPWLGWVATQL